MKPESETKTIHVRSSGDLPDPVNGVITLRQNESYIFHTSDIGRNKLAVPAYTDKAV